MYKKIILLCFIALGFIAIASAPVKNNNVKMGYSYSLAGVVIPCASDKDIMTYTDINY